jgi:hypothetical protein
MPPPKKKQLPPGLLSDPPATEHQKIQLERLEKQYGNGGVGTATPEPDMSTPVSALPSLDLSPDEEIARRKALEAAMNAAGLYRGDLAKYVNRWKDLSEVGVPPWVLHKTLSPPPPLSREVQGLLGLPYSPR